MSESHNIYIIGSGAIGVALAVGLAMNGRKVTLVRTSIDEKFREQINFTIKNNQGKQVNEFVEVTSLSNIYKFDGIVVIATKAYSNKNIAEKIKPIIGFSPLVIFQNGINVEKPFIEFGYEKIFRCVIYATCQKTKDNFYVFNSISNSPIGISMGSVEELNNIVSILNTEFFPFYSQLSIQKNIWKKAIINSVFNSICPLIEIDNGIFCRNEKALSLSREVVLECVQLTKRLEIDLSTEEINEQILLISKGSSGQYISTLQDILNNRETEIEFLNIAIAKKGLELFPPIHLNKTKLLGEMILLKSSIRKSSSTQH